MYYEFFFFVEVFCFFDFKKLTCLLSQSFLCYLESVHITSLPDITNKCFLFLIKQT